MPTITEEPRPLAQVIRANLLAELARRELNPQEFVQNTLGLSRMAAFRRLGATQRNDKRAKATEELLPFSPPEVDLLAAALDVSTDRLTAQDPFHGVGSGQ